VSSKLRMTVRYGYEGGLYSHNGIELAVAIEVDADDLGGNAAVTRGPTLLKVSAKVAVVVTSHVTGCLPCLTITDMQGEINGT
jgi:hypothetical protein